MFAVAGQFSNMGRLQYKGWKTTCCIEVGHDVHAIRLSVAIYDNMANFYFSNSCAFFLAQHFLPYGN